MNDENKKTEENYIKKLFENPLDRESRVELTKIYLKQKLFNKAEMLWLEYGDYLDKIPQNQININEAVEFAINMSKNIQVEINKEKIQQIITKEMSKTAKKLQAEGDFANAKKTYEYLLSLSLKKDEKNEIEKKLGKLYFVFGKFEEAEKYLEKYCILEPNNLEVEKILIKTYEKLNKKEEAKNLLIKNIKKYPNNLTLKLKLGKIYLNDKEIEKAQKEFLDIIRDNPNAMQAKLAMAKTYAIKAGNEKKEKIYDILLDNLGDYIIDENQDKKTRTTIIKKHINGLKNNKNNYGAFYKENYISKITDAMMLIIQKKVKPLEEFKEVDIYCLLSENVGISLGNEGYKNKLNNITLIYSKGTENMLVAFPTKDLNQINLTKENFKLNQNQDQDKEI